MMGHFFFY